MKIRWKLKKNVLLSSIFIHLSSLSSISDSICILIGILWNGLQKDTWGIPFCGIECMAFYRMKTGWKMNEKHRSVQVNIDNWSKSLFNKMKKEDPGFAT